MVYLIIGILILLFYLFAAPNFPIAFRIFCGRLPCFCRLPGPRWYFAIVDQVF